MKIPLAPVVPAPTCLQHRTESQDLQEDGVGDFTKCEEHSGTSCTRQSTRQHTCSVLRNQAGNAQGNVAGHMPSHASSNGSSNVLGSGFFLMLYVVACPGPPPTVSAKMFG